ncbi:MAG TPA: ABC transporter permease [Acidimicrobiales bacterium]|nr:ABC transporter permease [Acidimicrobiales bacterium]
MILLSPEPRRAGLPTYARSCAALFARDLFVVRRTFVPFLLRTVMQPLMLMFVFTYLFPRIGQAVGGAAGAEAFSAMLLSGVVGLAMVMQGIQSVALQLVQEIGFTREIDDRAMAPVPLTGVVVARALSGASQSLIAALVVFPLAYVVPATPVHLDVDFALLVPTLLLGSLLAASLGLAIGTMFDARHVMLFFTIIVLPLTFLGAVFYTWSSLSTVRWVQLLVLLNPLMYLNEGLRASLTDVPHLSPAAVFPALAAMLVVSLVAGARGFARHVRS